mmetsp:Transcript_161/g.440  ORF Transcript_161/g.440 Transcript_161/m.440 type:complete len:202 (-) Transcript_161:401-1006(-)
MKWGPIRCPRASCTSFALLLGVSLVLRLLDVNACPRVRLGRGRGTLEHRLRGLLINLAVVGHRGRALPGLALEDRGALLRGSVAGPRLPAVARVRLALGGTALEGGGLLRLGLRPGVAVAHVCTGGLGRGLEDGWPVGHRRGRDARPDVCARGTRRALKHGGDIRCRLGCSASASGHIGARGPRCALEDGGPLGHRHGRDA